LSTELNNFFHPSLDHIITMILIFLLMDTSDSVLKHQVLFLLTCYIN